MRNNAGWPSADERGEGIMRERAAERAFAQHRAIWISDLHLGTRRCKARALLRFLVNHKAETLYLVGDIVDGWNLGERWYWCEAQAAVVQQIAAWGRHGGRVVFLPGNHDEASVEVVRELLGPEVLFRPHLIHETADGRRMLVIHGHQFDRALNPNRWTWFAGSRAYGVVQRFNEWYSPPEEAGEARVRARGGFKARVKRAVELATDFRDRAVVEAAREHRVDGVICGHIHRAEERTIGDVLYVNDGDWVHSCTALVEDFDGRLWLRAFDPSGRPAAGEDMRAVAA